MIEAPTDKVGRNFTVRISAAFAAKAGGSYLLVGTKGRNKKNKLLPEYAETYLWRFFNDKIGKKTEQDIKLPADLEPGEEILIRLLSIVSKTKLVTADEKTVRFAP